VLSVLFFLFLFAEQHESIEEESGEGAEYSPNPRHERAERDHRRDEECGNAGKNNSQRFQSQTSFRLRARGGGCLILSL
jgi:hypothetical protein